MKQPQRVLPFLAVAAVSCAAGAADLRISQVYGGGGSATAASTYNKDYVELFNAGSTPINLAGYVLEYGSATGNWGSAAANYFIFPKGAVIQPCSYLLVASTTASAGGGALPVKINVGWSLKRAFSAALTSASVTVGACSSSRA